MNLLCRYDWLYLGTSPKVNQSYWYACSVIFHHCSKSFKIKKKDNTIIGVTFLFLLVKHYILQHSTQSGILKLLKVSQIILKSAYKVTPFLPQSFNKFSKNNFYAFKHCTYHSDPSFPSDFFVAVLKYFFDCNT